MPSTPRPAMDVLASLLGPPAAYRTIEIAQAQTVAGEDEWKRAAEIIVDDLVLDAELNIDHRDIPEEIAGVSAHASIRPHSRDTAIREIQHIGQTQSLLERKHAHDLRKALVLDFQRIAPFLFGPENASARPHLEGVALEWMAVIGNNEALPDLLQVSARLLSLEDVDWFLRACPAPSARSAMGALDTLMQVSTHCLSTVATHDLADHAPAFVQWCARSRDWAQARKSPTAHAIYLANYLLDPQKRLCCAMDSCGFSFSIERVHWKDMLAHVLDKDKKDLIASDVGGFIEAHAPAMARSWPQWAMLPLREADQQDYRYATVNLEMGTILHALLVNVKETAKRKKIEAVIAQAVLEQSTPCVIASMPRFRL